MAKPRLWVVVCLAALLLASASEYGDRLAVATQQYEQQQIQKRLEELRKGLEEVQHEDIVYPILRLTSASDLTP